MKSHRHAYVGTSGWQSSAFVGPFYPLNVVSARRLSYYSKHFNSVELNSTFYNFSRASTFEKRYAETSPHFVFAIKANAAFTHEHPLCDPENDWPRFFEPLRVLKQKLGPILFQFPASYDCHLSDLKKWLNYLDPGFKYTFEFRNKSWHKAAVYKVLEKHDAAFCNYDFRQYHPTPVITASWSYFRFHGPLKQPYRGSYSDEALEKWRDVITQEFKNLDIYAYFDNTMSPEAIRNACKLKQLVS